MAIFHFKKLFFLARKKCLRSHFSFMSFKDAKPMLKNDKQ